ncbi:MAG: MFS transporter [Thermoleophilia bacterium]|nr:MFS transporter [Thermoleophilia bacterium]
MTSTPLVETYREGGRAGDRLALCLMLVNVANSIAMSLVPIVQNQLQDEFSLSGAQIGLLTSVFMLAFAIGSIPAGVAVTRWGGRTLAAGVVSFTVGAVVFALSSSYAGFLVGRMFQGLGGATIIPVTNQLFTEYVDPARQARALGIFGSGHGVGVVLALLIMPSIQAAAGYRGVFLLTAAIAALLGLVAVLQGPVRARARAGAQRVSFATTLRDVAVVALNGRLLLLAVINIGVMAVVVGILAWTPAFLQDQRGTGISVAAYLTAAVGVAQLLGNIVGAAAMARWGKPFVLLSGMAVMMVFTALAPVVPGAGLAIAFVIVAGFMTMALFPAILGSVPDIVPKIEQVGSASAFLNLTNLLGTLLAPWVFGILLDVYGAAPGRSGYLAGYLWLAVFPFVGTLAGAFYMRGRERKKTA